MVMTNDFLTAEKGQNFQNCGGGGGGGGGGWGVGGAGNIQRMGFTDQPC